MRFRVELLLKNTSLRVLRAIEEVKFSKDYQETTRRFSKTHHDFVVWLPFAFIRASSARIGAHAALDDGCVWLQRIIRGGGGLLLG